MSTFEQIQKFVQRIEEGLEGTWQYETGRQYLTFVKPPEVGGIGKLMLANDAALKSDRTLEYEIVFVEDNIGNEVFINIIVRTSGEKIQYQLTLDYMNSYIGDMYLTDSSGLHLYYQRLMPRTAADSPA